MQNEQFIAAIKQISAERKISIEEIINALKNAILTAVKNLPTFSKSEKERLVVHIDSETGKVSLFIQKDVVEKVKSPSIEIELKEAQNANPKAKIGSTALVEISPKEDFGRIMAQAVRQFMAQRLSDLEKESVINQFVGKINQIVTVYVTKISKEGDVICELGKLKAIMKFNDRIPGEQYKLGSSIKVILKEIVNTEKEKLVYVSRSDPKFIEALFKLEVPEMESGSVEIVKIAREAGSRTKIAVRSNTEGVDAIGAFIGQRGARINAVSNELKNQYIDEKIDVVLWSDSPENFIKNVIKPIKSLEILDAKKKKALVIVPDDHLPIAIGKEGQNIRLCCQITGWDISVIGESENKKS